MPSRATLIAATIALPLAITAGFTAESWNPYAKVANAIKGQVVNDAATPDPVPALQACANEDGSGSTLPCRWDATKQGNGKGTSFIITRPGHFIYDDGHVEDDAMSDAQALADEDCEHITDDVTYENCWVKVVEDTLHTKIGYDEYAVDDAGVYYLLETGPRS